MASKMRRSVMSGSESVSCLKYSPVYKFQSAGFNLLSRAAMRAKCVVRLGVGKCQNQLILDD